MSIHYRTSKTRLAQRRLELGKTQPYIAQDIGLYGWKYGDLERNKCSVVITETGQWTDDACRVAEYHGVEPDLLWPEIARKVRYRRTVIERTAVEAIVLTTVGEETREAKIPFDVLVEKNQVEMVREVVGMIPHDRDRDILRRYYGLSPYEIAQTLGEISVVYNRCRSLVMKLLCRAERAVRDELLRRERAAAFRVAAVRMKWRRTL